ncbi:MAG: hypothetical protein WDM92_06575 [Caulobacteraceae bacterium]
MALPEPVLVLALIAAVVGLGWTHRRDAERRRRQRARFFEGCEALFRTCRVVQDGPGYPVLTGHYRGFDVRLEPVVDALAVRKIPSLWIKATVLARSPVRAVFDLIMRPQGVEVYSPSGDLEHRVASPPGWPAQGVICTDDPKALPDLTLIEPHLSLFQDERMKELLITPKGTRLVRQVCQADRARYAVLRQAEFPAAALDPALARSLLDSAIDVWCSLQAPAPLLKAS